MALLDFIRERQASKQQSIANESQTPKPENAKQMFAREAAKEESSRKPVEQMPEAAKREAVDAARPAAQLMDKATQHRNETPPTGLSDTREALIRNQGGQSKAQESLSPTDHGKSHTPTQARSQNRSRGIER